MQTFLGVLDWNINLGQQTMSRKFREAASAGDIRRLADDSFGEVRLTAYEDSDGEVAVFFSNLSDSTVLAMYWTPVLNMHHFKEIVDVYWLQVGSGIDPKTNQRRDGFKDRFDAATALNGFLSPQPD